MTTSTLVTFSCPCGATIDTFENATVICKCGRICERTYDEAERAQRDRHRKAEARKRNALTSTSVRGAPPPAGI
jgi:hypothetical protein